MICKSLLATLEVYLIMPNSKKQKHISPNAKSETFSVTRRFLWLRRNFAYCLAVSTIIWIVGFCYYIEHFIGWSSILALSPTDVAPFVLSITLPLLAIWFILAYIERSSSLDANAELLQNFVNNLIYPDDEIPQNIKALATIIQEQMKQLQNENKQVTSLYSQLKMDLDNRVQELSSVLSSIENYSVTTLSKLNDEVKRLADRCAYITDKTNNTVSTLRDCTTDITQNSEKFLGNITPILDEISAVSSNIKNNISDNKLNLSEMKNQLSDCADLSKTHFKDMLQKIAENTTQTERLFYKTSEEFSSLYKHLDSSISGVEERLDEQKNLIYTQTKVLNHNSDLLNNKLAKYGKNVSAEIDRLVKNSADLEKITKKQISALKVIGVETNKAVNGIGDTFETKRADLERRCESTISSMQNVVIALNKETDKLMSFTTLTQTKNNDLQNIAETIVDKIGDISSKLATKTDTLKDKAVEMIDKFTVAGELINRQTDKMNTTSSVFVNNSQQGIKLLEEQELYLNNAISVVNSISEKLSKLNIDIKQLSEDITVGISDVDTKLRQENLFNKSTTSATSSANINKDALLQTARGIYKFLSNIGVNPEKIFEKQNMFDLWDSYLSGEESLFTDISPINLSRKQTLSIRRAFDDNDNFHNLSIQYLFLMDMLVKEISNQSLENRKQLIDISVNNALDKVYLILVKALNNMD